MTGLRDDDRKDPCLPLYPLNRGTVGGWGLEMEKCFFFFTATVSINSTITFLPVSSLTCAVRAMRGRMSAPGFSQ